MQTTSPSSQAKDSNDFSRGGQSQKTKTKELNRDYGNKNKMYIFRLTILRSPLFAMANNQFSRVQAGGTDSASDEDGAARRHQRRDTLLRARREETARDGARTMEGAELWRAFDSGADAKSPIGCAPVGRKYAAEKGGILGQRFGGEI